MTEVALGGVDPVTAVALVGALGVGSQWIAWRLRMPAIVLMLLAGVLVGPVIGAFVPARDLGALVMPLVSIAVAVILFEGGLTLNLRDLRDAAEGVRRLTLIGAPLGWLLSALALRYAGGLSWESSAVFGGILIVTGPTVIAPLLRQARLARRPALLLQWEAIVNDPIGALAAVLAFEVVVVLRTATEFGSAALDLLVGIVVAAGVGALAGRGIARAFHRGYVPEYMKVSALFVILLAVFALCDHVLHESGLLAVTVMGIVIANADLPSYAELRRFKEHATVLLVSGVFILLAAQLDFETLARLDWRSALVVIALVLLARPLTVLISLITTRLPWRERVLVAFTGPRGVVLVAVAGLFGERLVALGIEDAALVAPLAFVLVAATVVVHGFTLGPFARLLGLTGSETPGVMLVGASPWTTGFAEALKQAEVPVLLTDPNRSRLREARETGLPTFYGDILSEAAEHGLELVAYESIVAATDNDAYNTLVATNLGPEYGRENVYQVSRVRPPGARHTLPATLGGRPFGRDETIHQLNRRIAEGWSFRTTRLTEKFTLAEWREKRPEAILLAQVTPGGRFSMLMPEDEPDERPDTRLFSMAPPDTAEVAAESATEAPEP
ncbi:cation:proton antiporter [Roseitranquillus sediminis]|uniref:cation:proton antiporter n=1 Tax=Roseitranquillus sediminis TaxID=2809051 RepID=UPI003872EB02